MDEKVNKNEIYIQCLIQFSEGKEYAWIPNKFKGKYIKIGTMIRVKDTDQWGCITQIFGARPAFEVKARERDWVKTRQASDI